MNQITKDDTLALRAVPTLNRYQIAATKSAVYPGQGSSLGLIYCALKLNGEAGELAEHVGKAMRDDNFTPTDEANDIMYVNGGLTPDRYVLLKKEIGDCLWYLSALCNELGTTLEDVAVTNLTKLQDRGTRGTLQGSGDNR